MSVFKCKMCGGTLEVEEGRSVAICDYCGSEQTVSTNHDEITVNLFNRANNLRLKNDFDKAQQLYEKILEEDDSNAEAHWGVVLCKYGVEYVEDSRTHTRIPTCHRTQVESVMTDADYLSAIENADIMQRRVYEDEAKEIARLQKEILDISSKEEPFDVFICYKEKDDKGQRTKDSVIANDIYYQLTNSGFKVFYAAITLEGKLGTEYEPYIYAALHSAKVMLVVGTKPEYFNAVWVKNEWSRYLAIMKSDRSRVLIPCYQDMDAYDLPDEFAHLQAQDMSKIGFLQDLIRGVNKVLKANEKPEQVKETVVVQQTVGASNAEQLLKRGYLALEDGEWEKADSFFEETLNQNAENAEAYLGKLMAELRVSKRAELSNRKEPFDNYRNYQKAIRFGNEALKAELAGYIHATQWNIGLGQLVRVLCERKKQLERLKSEARERQERLEQLVRLEKQRAQNAPVQNIVSAGSEHTVGLKSDGTVVATGNNENGQCKVSRWTDIVAISAGNYHTVGLKSDGTVVATGNNKNGQCNVSGWTDIVAVSAGYFHTVGLKSDGTVVAVRSNEYCKWCNVSGWTDIVAISAGYLHTVGLKSDGTVVAVGSNEYGRCNVSDWTDVVAVSAGYYHTVGLKSDGTVVAVGSNEYGRCNVSDWTDVVAVSTAWGHTVGLKSDGTVVATGNNENGQCNVSDWTDIVAVSAGNYHTVGLKSDGTVVAVRSNEYGKCNVSGWKLFNSIDTLERERKDALQTELANLKGLFTGKRRKEIEAQLAQIENELRKLK